MYRIARPLQSRKAICLSQLAKSPIARCALIAQGVRIRRHPFTSATATTAEPPSIEHFRNAAFTPERPLLIPRLYTNGTTFLPAVDKWFRPSLSATAGPDASAAQLNHAYFAPHAAAIVPLELTTHDPISGETSFTRLDRPLADFLAFVALREEQPHAETNTPQTSLYLAQHPLASLPAALQADVPTPPLVTHAGRGDVYASSLWLGLAPTATPLHRDPNPNLLVQLCGRKRIRMLAPSVGAEVFAAVRAQLGQTAAGASVRGEEMMVGGERAGLDAWLWGEAWRAARETLGDAGAWEGEIGPGGAVFVPRGWWHGVQSEGEGITGSVNWWFR